MKKVSIFEKIKNTSRKVADSCIRFIDALSKPKLKVALISYYYKKPSISGVGIHVRNLAKFLAKHNCEVHVFCNSDEEERYTDDGVVVHGIGRILTPIDDAFSKKRLEYNLFESDVTKEIIRENMRRRFDIIHTHGSLTKAAFTIKKVYGIRWIHTFHAIEKLRVRKLSKEEKQFSDLVSWIEQTVNYADGTIFVSKKLLREGKKNYNLKSTRVIPNGIDLDLFRPQSITNKNILFIGRFSKDKGIELIPEFIESIMSRTNDSTVTIIAPFKSLGKDLNKIFDTLKRQERHYYRRINLITKPQTQEELIKHYNNCQVYMQPSKYESFGLCILEAMSVGRPAIAFKVGGIPEVVGDTGIVVKTKEEFTSAIMHLLEDKKRCETLGKKASIRAKEFDWNKITMMTMKYYTEA